MTSNSMLDESLDMVGGEFLADPFHPVSVTDLELAFPAQVGHLMPHPRNIPKMFWEDSRDSTWNAFAYRLFYGPTLPKDTTFAMKDGIDGETAWRHLLAIRASYQPKHQHKMAALAYLASLWIDAVFVVPEGHEPGQDIDADLVEVLYGSLVETLLADDDTAPTQDQEKSA